MRRKTKTDPVFPPDDDRGDTDEAVNVDHWLAEPKCEGGQDVEKVN